MNGETITRLRAAPKLDPYSNEVTDLDWDDVDELDIPNVAVEPVSVAEQVTDGSEQLVIDARLYVPYQADVLPLDRVVVRSQTFEVGGTRADWKNPFTGAEPGSVLNVRRVAG